MPWNHILHALRNPIAESRLPMLGKRLEKAIKKEYRREKYDHQQRGQALPEALRAPEEEYLADRLGHIQDQLAWIGEADPTPGGTYSNWITKMMLSGSLIFPEDISKVQGKLKGFQLNQYKLPKENRDIASYKTYGELAKTLEEYSDVMGKKEGHRYALQEGQEILFETTTKDGFGMVRNFYTVFEVTNTEAAAKMARHTEWCVKDPKYSEQYLDAGPLFFIDRDGARFVLAHYGDGEYTLMDIWDEPITSEARKELMPVLRSLFAPDEDAEAREGLAYLGEFPEDLEMERKILNLLHENPEEVVRQEGSLLALWELLHNLQDESKENLLELFSMTLGSLYVQPFKECLASIQKITNTRGWSKYYQEFALQGIPYKRNRTKGFWGETVRKGALKASGHLSFLSFCHGTVPDITLLIAVLKYFAKNANPRHAACAKMAKSLEGLLFEIVQTYTVKLLDLFGYKSRKDRIKKGAVAQVAEYLWLVTNHPIPRIKSSAAFLGEDNLPRYLIKAGAQTGYDGRWDRNMPLRSDVHLLEKTDPVIFALVKQTWFKNAFKEYYIRQVAEWVYNHKGTNQGLREDVSYLHGQISRDGMITLYFSYEDIAEDISSEDEADDNTEGKEHGNAYEHCNALKDALDEWDRGGLIGWLSKWKSRDFRKTSAYMPKGDDEKDDSGGWLDYFVGRLNQSARRIPLKWDKSDVGDGFEDWSDEYELEDAYREDEDDEDSDIMLSFKISATREMNIYDVLYIMARSVSRNSNKPWD